MACLERTLAVQDCSLRPVSPPDSLACAAQDRLLRRDHGRVSPVAAMRNEAPARSSVTRRIVIGVAPDVFFSGFAYRGGEPAREQIERLRHVRAGRNSKIVAEHLQGLEQAARGQENLIPLILAAA